MEQLPNVSDPVVLRVDADREYPSKVENLGVGLLVVARPHDLTDDTAVGSGTKVSVLWADSGGEVTVLPTQLLSAHAEGPLQLWSLVVIGATYTEQRRRSERVSVAGPVELRSASDDETYPVTGSLIDVSEGGVRCAVEAGAADVFLTGSDQVIAEFRFGSAVYTIPGRAEFLRASARPAEFEELVVVFDEPVAAAEALRNEVFAQQADGGQ